MKTVEPYKNKIKVSFTKSKGAKKYYVYRAIKNNKTNKIGKYKKIKTLPASTTSFIDKGLKPDRWYYYKVKTIAKNSRLNSSRSKAARDITNGNSLQYALKNVKSKSNKLKGKRSSSSAVLSHTDHRVGESLLWII